MIVYTTHIHVSESEQHPATGVVLVFNKYPTLKSILAAMEEDPVTKLPKYSVFRTVVKQALDTYGVPQLFKVLGFTASGVRSTWSFSGYSDTDALIGTDLGHITIHAKEVWNDDE